MAILKFLFVVMAATLILSACGGGNEAAKSSEIDWTALAGEDGLADTDAATGLVVLDQGFSIVLDDASVGVIVKNTSDEPACFIDIQMDFYDRNEEPVGDSSLSLNELGPGEVAYLAVPPYGGAYGSFPKSLEVTLAGSLSGCDPEPSVWITQPRGKPSFSENELLTLSPVITNDSSYRLTAGDFSCVYFRGKKIVGGVNVSLSQDIPAGRSKTEKITDFAPKGVTSARCSFINRYYDWA